LYKLVSGADGKQACVFCCKGEQHGIPIIAISWYVYAAVHLAVPQQVQAATSYKGRETRSVWGAHLPETSG
jgi:hypothetical protein